MGASRNDFKKYPRTPHLFGSSGTPDDKHLSEKDSLRIISDESLIVEEKLDGTNVGIHFTPQDKMILQCRGHLIIEGMHPQYDLFKQWAAVKRPKLEAMLRSDFILFGEWMYARHSVHYRQLPHYFFEFDIFDKSAQCFLSLERRLKLLAGAGVQTVPVVHNGPLQKKQIEGLVGPSDFDSRFENPLTNCADNLMEGLYFRTENDGVVTARAKFVRPEFTEKIKQSTHWQQQSMVPNLLKAGAEIWS